VTRESGAYTSVVHGEQWIVVVGELQARPNITVHMNLIDSTIEFG
jgi:hypothetical protein